MTEHSHPVAGVWRRLAAAVYDGFLMFAVLFVASLLPALLLNSNQLSSSPATDSVVHELNAPLQGWFYSLYLLLLIFAFYGWFWRKSGQTLGMQAWHLKLESSSGGQISWKQVLIRLPVAALAFFLCGAGYWWAWIDKQGRSWQDIASGSRVIQLPKHAK